MDLDENRDGGVGQWLCNWGGGGSVMMISDLGIREGAKKCINYGLWSSLIFFYILYHSTT